MSDPIPLLTELALTPAAELDGFRRRHLAAFPAASPARLADAKALLDALGRALEDPGDAARWAALEAARASLAALSAPDTAGTGTLPLQGGAADGSATLPFTAARTVATPPGGAPARAPIGSTGTVATRDGAQGAGLPFGEHELTLEQYVALCAESALRPAQTAEINQRYGLGAPGARGRVDLAWQRRLAADGALRERWRAQFDELKRRG